MQKLITGIHSFQNDIFETRRPQFERLAKGQAPQALFITCSDSRIDPSMLMQSEPGDIFILRNAGNIIPAHGASNGGEAATIEYAIMALGVRDIVICGHSHCGAVKAALADQPMDDLPMVKRWLDHADATRRIVREKYADRSEEERNIVGVEENVLVQIEHLRTHPAVASKLAAGKLRLHAWVYKLETGEVFTYDSAEGQYISLGTDSLAMKSVTLSR